MRIATARSLAIVAILVLAELVPAADWQPAAGPLSTRWAKNVSPANVWSEYPRPQMVRPEWVNLNGLWDYAITDAYSANPASYDGQILVPFPVESALSGVRKPVSPQQRLWYRRKIDAPKVAADQRLLLHFGAVDWQCTVWVNGQECGAHTGGYDPFTLDITDALKPEGNELIVAVTDPTDTGTQPKGKQVLKPQGIMYTAVTGIWQTVWLEVVSVNHIQSLKLVPDIDNERLLITVTTSSGKAVRATVMDAGTVVSSVDGIAGEPIVLPVAHPKLWTPDQPHLYDLRIELLGDGKVLDRVDSYFGMRKTEVKKDADGIPRLMLNNRVLFQYGPLDQGWWPDGLYTPPTDEAIRYDIEMTKKFGMNMARKHVKYECARWYYWCDRMGLLVWQDMPSGSFERDDAAKANYRRELKAMIDTLHNFPCIVMWVPFNEGWGQHDTPEVVKWLEEYEPTRPVNEASGWTDQGSGAISDMHNYPGPGMRPVEEKRAVVLGEFGGLGMPVAGHTWQAKENWGYVSYENAEDLTNHYVDLLTRMRPLIGQGLCAAVYTQTTDVEIEVNGLMTYDREVNKIDVARAAAAARKLYLPPPRVSTLVPTSQAQPQSWKYTTETPQDNWSQVDFDDTNWKQGPGGFGTQATPGSTIGTTWNTSDIWIRREFQLQDVAGDGELSLSIHHDEVAEVYVNGQLAAKLTGYTTSYVTIPLSADVIKVLTPGANTLAIHCQQTQGGQYIDAGIVLMQEQAPSAAPPAAQSTEDLGKLSEAELLKKISSQNISVVDLHVHIRNGMTPEIALERQQTTGVGIGVLRNIGRGWEIETDAQLREFLNSVKDLPLLVGLQVNDRDWAQRHAPELIQQLDYVLADTMIMPMPTDDGPPVKLWLADLVKIDDPQAWMERYVRYNLKVLAEPINVLANPTFLPAVLEKQYDELWTDERMRQVIQAAIDHDVALEINASSQWPHDRFIRLAKEMGAKFSFGTNNFDAKPISMRRCLEAILRHGLTAEQVYVPQDKSTVAGQ